MYLDEFFEPFFEPIGSGFRGAFSRGQLFKAPCLYHNENRDLWRPNEFTVSETAAHSFVIESAGQDAYRRAIPLAAPPLATNEEFPVIRSKMRPLLLLAPLEAPAEDFTAQDRSLYRRVGVVAPIYGTLKKGIGDPKFRIETLNRIRLLEYPHLLYVPEWPGGLSEDSIVRFDHLQTAFLSHLKPINLRVSHEVLDIIFGLVEFLFSGRYSGNYQVLREELLESAKE